jgi:outer membrane lipoprotein SlyB
MKRLLALAGRAAAVAMVGCAGQLTAAESPDRIDYGVVESIQIYSAPDDQPINAGTVLGGVAGGVIGHQIGRGRGNTAATIAGAVGGAVIGNEVHKSQVQNSRYRITVRLDSGTQLILEETRDVELRIGDRVRVENNHVSRI